MNKSAASAASLMGFQAVMKSAASAASPGTKKIRKNIQKMTEKLPFWAQRRLQAPKCRFLAPSGARNLHLQHLRLSFSIAAFFLQYLAALAAKYMEKMQKNKKNCLFWPFFSDAF